ncbi:MAG: LysR family transcriptional regulator [Lachnospiraceae bacterium]|nr:LysR family transcriptional regulator [Lachnospiraceae bacterium]
MELRVLNYFLMVAREENITKAAQLLQVTQPTLSRQLMQLEEELGVKLFDRTSHSIILTNEGMLLKRRAQEMLTLAEKAKMELKQDEKSLTGKISIGSGELRSMDELAEWISVFQENHPLVTFELFSGTADSIKRQMENGTIDLGLLLEPVDTAKYEFIRMKTKEEWCALVPDTSIFAEKGFVTPEDIAACPVLLPVRNPVKNELASWLGDYAKDLNVLSTFNLLYNATVMARKNSGLILAIKLNCSYEGLTFVPFKPSMTLSSVLTWKERQIFSPTTTAFIEFIKKCSKGIE